MTGVLNYMQMKEVYHIYSNQTAKIKTKQNERKCSLVFRSGLSYCCFPSILPMEGCFVVSEVLLDNQISAIIHQQDLH